MTNQKIPLAERNALDATSPLAKALAGLVALAVAMGIGRFAFTPVMPMMLQDTGLSIASGSALASANYLGYLLGALSAMVLRIRPERAIRGALVTIGIATMAMGLSLPFAAWLLLRMLAGFASAWVLISVSTWCLETLAAYQRPFLNSLVFAGVGSGIVAAGLLCMAMTKNNAGSAQAWIALGLLSVIATALVWRFFPPHAAAADGAKEAGPGTFRWNAHAVRLVCCYGVFGFGYIIPATFLPVMAKNALHGSAAFGWTWPLFGVAALVSTLAVATLRRHISNRRLWMVSHWVMAVGILLPVWSPQLFTILAAALCVGSTFMVITLVALQEAKQIAGRDATGLIAAMTAAFAGGQIVGPLTVRVAGGGNASFSAGLIVAAVMLAAGALLLIVPAKQTD
jgi:predicted MFS family arabinose efflux permease